MLIKNPKYQPIEEIRKQYDGYCVFLVRCKGSEYDPEGGEVAAYNKSLAALTIEVDPLIDDENSGVSTFETYTSFAGFSVIQVVPYED